MNTSIAQIILLLLCALPCLLALPASIVEGLQTSGFLSSFYSYLSPSLIETLSSPAFEGIVFAFVDPPGNGTAPPLTYPIEAYISSGKALPLSSLRPPLTLTTLDPNVTLYVDRTLGGIAHIHPGPIAQNPNDFATVLMSQFIEGGKGIIYVIDKQY